MSKIMSLFCKKFYLEIIVKNHLKNDPFKTLIL